MIPKGSLSGLTGVQSFTLLISMSAAILKYVNELAAMMFLTFMKSSRVSIRYGSDSLPFPLRVRTHFWSDVVRTIKWLSYRV